jgi:protein-L-isoaspartate(D-aspartate) O-methyltransferase
MVNPETRAVYARAVTTAAHVRNSAIQAAFAAVPRERFLGPPPWQVVSDFGTVRATDDPTLLYSDVLVAIDRARGINNGEPQLWALVFDRLALAEGMRVLHVGAGTGYYTAILAELVGPSGSVTALEVEADLAARAQDALAAWPQVTVMAKDASELTDLPFDGIVFSCGVTGLPDPWLEGLAPGARIAVPLTGVDHAGIFLLLIRQEAGFEVVPLCGVSIYPAAGFRRPQEERQLDGVRRADREALWSARSLRHVAATEPAERIYGFGGHVLSMQPLAR